MNVVAIAEGTAPRNSGYAAPLPGGRSAQICRTFWLNNAWSCAIIHSHDEPVAVGTRQTSHTRNRCAKDFAPPSSVKEAGRPCPALEDIILILKRDFMKDFYYEINDSKNNFEYWINQDYIPENLKDELRKSNLLFVPQSFHRDQEYLTFPVNTEELYQYIIENSSKDINPNICISSTDYREIALHGYEIYLGSFVVSCIIAPIFVNLISEYLKRKIYRNNDDPTININITIVNINNSAKELRIREPYSKFIEIQKDLLTYDNNGKAENRKYIGKKYDEFS